MRYIYPGMEEPCKLKLCNGFSIEIDYVKGFVLLRYRDINETY